MAKLTATLPALGEYVISGKAGNTTIDFSNQQAILTLNKALLAHHYGISDWSIPEGYLCPPVPGRADYLQHTADLLASHNKGIIPLGNSVRVLDVGVGSGAIYPLIGHKTFGWSFVGSDIDETALGSARHQVQNNTSLAEHIQLRHQRNASHFFKGIVNADEEFDLVICNPPFYVNAAEAIEASARKWKNLGKSRDMGTTRNFGGQLNELYCEGGELTFIRNMIAESFFYARKCYWFTTLVSRGEHIHELRRALNKVKPTEIQVIHMSQGQKSSRLLAWTFLQPAQQREWRARNFWE